MAFIDEVLQEPAYGWKNEQGELVKPTVKQLYAEAFRRINIFKDKRNWMAANNWIVTLFMVPFFVLFLFKYFSLGLLAAFIIYSMVIMSTHGTIWFHRYSTHKAYTFSHPFWRFITQNLVIRTFPEESYVVSHHVHHVKSEMPGDPYNAHAGLMYCMLSDVNHHSLNLNLSEENYRKAQNFLAHTGNHVNSYEEYKKWGSVSHPLKTNLHLLLNWAFWYGAFFLIGGHALACTLFAGGMFWFIFVRAFNYTGHGSGKVKHVDGIDFDRSNLSVNQSRPGWLSGEWHNNHHLYPGSARAGFLPYQLDGAWWYIKGLHLIGAVSSYRDSKPMFLKNHYAKYQASAAEVAAAYVKEELEPEPATVNN